MTGGAIAALTELFKFEDLFGSAAMDIIPFGFERCVVDLVHPEQRQRGADRMQKARLVDLQRGQRLTCLELANKLQFTLVESLHAR